MGDGIKKDEASRSPKRKKEVKQIKNTYGTRGGDGREQQKARQRDSSTAAVGRWGDSQLLGRKE